MKLDDRDQYKPGYKFAEWELQGVPLRIEIGPRDVDNEQVVLARRDTREKITVSVKEVTAKITDLLEIIQQNLFDRALKMREENTFTLDDYEEFKSVLEKGAFIRAHWCGSGECELAIKEETKATIRNIPFNEPKETGKCIYCGRSSNRRVIFARAY